MSRPRCFLAVNLMRQSRHRLYSTTRPDPPISSLESIESLPIIPTCPAPTCPCAATPTGLDIDHQNPMVKPDYSRHVVIHTGRNDWASRIVDEPSSVFGDIHPEKPRANLARSLKDLVGLGGKYYNVSGTA